MHAKIAKQQVFIVETARSYQAFSVSLKRGKRGKDYGRR
jgi:hypothetical protein